MRSQTLTSRVVWGTVVAASIAAVVSASAAAGLSGWLMLRAEDRRLLDAAQVLADELVSGEEGSPAEALEHETSETSHMGLVFSVFDETGRVAGDARLPRLQPGRCDSVAGHPLRVCSVSSSVGLEISAAGAHSDVGAMLAGAALAAALLAAAVAWVVSRSVARTAIGPLTRLEQRLVAIDRPDLKAELGTAEGVIEVDRLRATLEGLLARLLGALAHAERFAADAAHELRTPLTAVRAELELLAEQSPSQAQQLQRARQTLARLEALVERLLVLATPERSQPARDEAVSLRDVVEDVVASLPPAEHGRVSVGEGDVTVRGDSSLLQALVSNALSNALKFGTRASVAIGLDGRQAVLRVDDDGPGVPPSERDRVFEPFFSSAQARMQGKAGHGLGLAIIAHIARRHGGSARFDEATGGARLEVRLPAEGT